MSFVGKTAVVTGAGGISGIGFAVSRHLLLNGVEKLAIFDVIYSPEVIEKLKSEFPDKTNIAFQKTDVTNKTEVEDSFNEIFRKFGYIDILVNSVGIFNEQQLEKIFSVNVFGTIYSTQTAIELMSIEKGGKGGIIANISSVCGLDAFFPQPIYNATKHAVVGFTRSLGDPFYFNIYGIKFVLFCPGVTDTPFLTGINDRLYRKDAEEVANERTAGLPRQSADVCGKVLVDLLNKSNNGSIWMIDDGEAKEVTLKNHWLPN